MALSNSEYNLIMREYEERRYKSKWELDKRIKEVYDRLPRIKEINDEISTVAVDNIKARFLSGDNFGPEKKEELGTKIHSLVLEKTQLLEENGYGRDYLQMYYICNDCKDTGYIGNEKCHCLKEKITELLYSRSNIKEILERENFGSFNIGLYSDEYQDKLTGVRASENIRNVFNICRDFAGNFGSEFKNLFIYGETGVGKTFLTNCIAKELMDKSYSVVYVSAVHMFELLANQQFNRGDNMSGTAKEDFINCDLLIIDDLGTELVNTFTMSALFNCINERFLNRKPVIISTNLSIGDVRNMYSERVSSRIASNYTMLKVFGEDLRIVTSLGLTK